MTRVYKNVPKLRRQSAHTPPRLSKTTDSKGGIRYRGSTMLHGVNGEGKAARTILLARQFKSYLVNQMVAAFSLQNTAMASRHRREGD